MSRLLWQRLRVVRRSWSSDTFQISKFEPRRNRQPFVPLLNNEKTASWIQHDSIPDQTHSNVKVVCTMGPATRNERVLERMILGGMSIARLNFSHGSIEEHLERAHQVRQVAERCSRHVAILESIFEQILVVRSTFLALLFFELESH